jgi:phage terminase small subunit
MIDESKLPPPADEEDRARPFSWTPARRMFVAHYLGEARFNATKAATLAGYSASAASRIGHELLKAPQVKAEIEVELNARAAAAGLTSERIIAEAMRIAFADPGRLFNGEGQLKSPDAIDADTRSAIASVDETANGKRIRLNDKMGALHFLAKVRGMMVDSMTLRTAPEDPLTSLITKIQTCGSTIKPVHKENEGE